MNGKPTKGMRIQSVQLAHSRFEFADPEGVEAVLQQIPEASRDLRLKYDVTVLEPKSKPQVLTVGLGVVVSGLVSDRSGKTQEGLLWQIMAAYEGHFTLDKEAAISESDVLRIHGPAQLYAFAREFIADISRRAGLQPIVYIPPWNFTASNEESAAKE